MRHTNFHRRLLAAGLLMAMAVSAFSTSQTLTFPPGGQLTLPVSNTNPNRVEVPGDRVVALHSAAGKLTDKRNTPAGAVLFSSDSVQPFTLFIETEHGQTFSLRAMPRDGEGRSYRLLGSQPVARPAARAWETAQPYESLLTALNRAALNRRLPDSYAPAPVGTDRLTAPAGLTLTAEEAWTGHALRLVRYRLRNPQSQAVTLNEADFWRPGVRAVMFGQRATRLLPATVMDVYITTGQEVRP